MIESADQAFREWQGRSFVDRVNDRWDEYFKWKYETFVKNKQDVAETTMNIRDLRIEIYDRKAKVVEAATSKIDVRV